MKAGSASHLRSHLINVCRGQGCHPTRLQIWPTPSSTPSRCSVLQAALYLTSASYKPSFGIVNGIIWSAAEHCQAQAKHCHSLDFAELVGSAEMQATEQDGPGPQLQVLLGPSTHEAGASWWSCACRSNQCCLVLASGQCCAWATGFPRPCACSPQTLKSARSVLKHLAPRPLASNSSTIVACSCIKTKPVWQLLVSYSHLRALLDAGRQGQAPCNCC